MKAYTKRFRVAIALLLCSMFCIQTGSAQVLFPNAPVSAGAYDIIFAIDNSQEFYAYNYAGDNIWLEALYGVMDQASAGSRFAVLSHRTVQNFTDIQTAEAALYSIPLYQGAADPAGLLAQAGDMFAGSVNQKMVVLSTPLCYNNDELINTIDVLTGQGILVYVVAFEKDVGKAESIQAAYDDVAVCQSTQETAIRLADLYAYLAEAQSQPVTAGPQAANAASTQTLDSAFRTGKHNYSAGVDQSSTAGGSYLVQLLNMYYMLPTYTTGYGPLDYAVCKSASQGNTHDLFSGGLDPQSIFQFWDEKADALLADTYFSVQQPASIQGLNDTLRQKIEKNLKQRYPVLVQVGNQYRLITRMENGSFYWMEESINFTNQIVRVLDTALYMQALLETPAVNDDLQIDGTSATVIITLPETGMEYRLEPAGGGVQLLGGKELRITRQGEFTVTVKTNFTGALPDCRRTNLYYNVNLFTDLQNGMWSKNYIFDMINRGVVHGYEDFTFRPADSTTILEYLAMLVYAADIPNPRGEGLEYVWPDDFLEYAEDYGLWPVDETGAPYVFSNTRDYSEEYDPNDPEDGDYGGVIPTYTSFDSLKAEDKHLPKKGGHGRHGYDNPIPRDFAFYLLWKVALSPECRVPNHLVEYPPADFSGRFSDYAQLEAVFKDEVDQLIQNNVVAGDDGLLTPKALITREQACRILSSAVFSFDQNSSFENLEFINDIAEVALEQDGETVITGETNEFGEGIHTFTVDWGTGGTYAISLTEQTDSRLTVAVYDRNYQRMTELSPGTGQYTLVAEERYTICVSGLAHKAYTLTISAQEIQYEPPLIEFTQKGGGVYLYTNNPESILREDLADEDQGNTLLLEEPDLTGKVVVHLTHSKRVDQGFEATFDTFIYNPNPTNIQIRVNKFGCQIPKEGYRDIQDWTMITAWSHYLGLNQFPSSDLLGLQNPSGAIISEEFPENNVPSILNGDQGFITIEPGKTVWLMEEYRKKTGIAPTRLVAASWSPIDVILEIEILNNAMATVGAAAYESFEAVNSPSRGRYVYIDRVNPVDPNQKVEWDVSHKAKGKANTLPVVETSLGLDVSDTVSGEIPVRIGNFKANPPILSDYWITNLNPFDGDDWDKTVESDMLGFTFTDENERTWYFDTRHKRGHADNEECTEPNQLPNADMMSMGNYGVTERYYVIFRNTSNQPKTIKYYMETYSGLFVRHNLNNSWNINSMKTLYLPEVYNHPYKEENEIVGYIQMEGETIEVRNNETWYYQWDSKLSQWKRISQETFLNFKEDKEHYKVDYYEADLEKNVQKNREIFTVTIPPNTSEYKVVFETLLTTNMLGGQRHSLVVE